MKSLLKIVALLVVLTWLNGCKISPGETVSPLVSPVVTSESSPVTIAPSPVVSAPDADKATIVGRLVLTDTQTSVAGRVILLGTLLPLEPEGHLIVTTEREGIRASADANGYFYFENLVPNTYVLILWSPMHSQVIVDLTTGAEVMITLEAGQIYDVGEIVIGDLY